MLKQCHGATEVWEHWPFRCPGTNLLCKQVNYFDVCSSHDKSFLKTFPWRQQNCFIGALGYVVNFRQVDYGQLLTKSLEKECLQRVVACYKGTYFHTESNGKWPLCDSMSVNLGTDIVWRFHAVTPKELKLKCLSTRSGFQSSKFLMTPSFSHGRRQKGCVCKELELMSTHHCSLHLQATFREQHPPTPQKNEGKSQLIASCSVAHSHWGPWLEEDRISCVQ